jgi:hypothetical protein
MLDTHHLRDELDVAQISRSAVRPAVSVRNGQGRAGGGHHRQAVRLLLVRALSAATAPSLFFLTTSAGRDRLNGVKHLGRKVGRLDHRAHSQCPGQRRSLSLPAATRRALAQMFIDRGRRGKLLLIIEPSRKGLTALFTVHAAMLQIRPSGPG